MNNFLEILEFCAFYIEYKNTKFRGINFHGRSNVKYFIQTQLLRFCKITSKVPSFPLLKITTKSTHLFPVKKEILIPWIELQINKIKKISKPYRVLKNFSKNNFSGKYEWRRNIIFQKISHFHVHSCILSTCTNQCTKNELFR